MVLQSSCLCHRGSSLSSFSRAMVSNLTISPHHLSHRRPRLGFSSSAPCFTFAQVGHRVALAQSSPPGTGGYCCSARCKSMQIITSLPNLHIGARKQPVTHGQRASLAQPGSIRRPDVNFQSIGNLPESVSRNSQGSPSHSRTARPPGRRLPSQMEGPACSSRLMGLSCTRRYEPSEMAPIMA